MEGKSMGRGASPKAPEKAVKPAAAVSGAGEVDSGTEVTLSTATPEADIYYTLNGNTPDTTGAKYTKAISITNAVTIKAIAVKAGMADSGVLEAAYTVAASKPEPKTPETPKEVPPKINGIEISRYPNITWFAREQLFSYEGLELVFVYGNGDRGRKLAAGEYSVDAVSTAKAMSRRRAVFPLSTES
jgi:hypothetical protein